MAVKKFIIKQTTNWNSRGEKTGTSTVQMDEDEISSYIALLSGKIEVFEQNLTLSVNAPTLVNNFDIADYVKIRHNVLKPIYISNSNKRPIVFKSSLQSAIATIGAFKPFEAPYTADLPSDVSIDTGNIALL